MEVKFASYARVASHPQADPTPITKQLAAIKVYGEARGWHCVGEYSDAPASGVSDARAGFRALLEAACSESPPFQIVLITNPSRIHRHPIEFASVERALAEHGVSIHSMSEGTR